MFRALIGCRTLPALCLVLCGAAIAPGIRTPLAAAPKPPADRHHYEVAALGFFRDHIGFDQGEDIATRIGDDICSMTDESYPALIQKNDPSMEVIYITADSKSSTDTELVLSVRWGPDHKVSLDTIPCNNTPSETCLRLYRSQIANEVIDHDCRVHKGARSCAIVAHSSVGH